MNTLVERLAELEHEQWAHWTKYMLDNLTPENIERWKRQVQTPYAELTDKEKESDRKWARIAIRAFGTHSRCIYCGKEFEQTIGRTTQ